MMKLLSKQKLIKSILILIMLAPSSGFAALTVVKDSGATTSVGSYLSDMKVPDKSTKAALLQMLQRNAGKLKGQPIEFNKLLFPVKSKFSVGDVKKHRMQGEIAKKLQAVTFYVVGDDVRSVHWLKTNASYLKKIGALGFLTNVSTKNRALFIEKDTGTNLMVVSLDGLESIVGTSNYPFLVYEGWVLQ